MERTRRMYGLLHVNSQQWLGRFNSHWGRTYDIDAAGLWASHGEADLALQALLQEAADRTARSREQWPTQFWWDVHGGLVTVERIDVITRFVMEPPPAVAAVDPKA